MFNLLTVLLLTEASICSEKIVLKDPFIIHADDSVSHLCAMIQAQVKCASGSRGISIIFDGKLILNLFDDHRTIEDIGMSIQPTVLFDIQIIPKPDVVALLEMTSEISNIENIPWFHNAMHCFNQINDSSAIQCQNVSALGDGLECDDNGYLIGIDLSHLDLFGTIHFESLPQSVRSLDLSFNDLDSLNLNELKGKSVERLNVEENKRFEFNNEYFLHEIGKIPNITELRVSSNQICPRIPDLATKNTKVRRWLSRPSLEANLKLFIDGHDITRGSHKSTVDVYSQMLRVVKGVTNKERIPWYLPSFDGMIIPPREWKAFRSGYEKTGKTRSNGRYKMNLSGLGLEGEIDLGSLPKRVRRLDLSNNNLSSILFGGAWLSFDLHALDLQNNDNLQIDLVEMEYLNTICLNHLAHLSLSSNQLTAIAITQEKQMTIGEYVRSWLETSTVKSVTVDGKLFTKYTL